MAAAVLDHDVGERDRAPVLSGLEPQVSLFAVDIVRCTRIFYGKSGLCYSTSYSNREIDL